MSIHDYIIQKYLLNSINKTLDLGCIGDNNCYKRNNGNLHIKIKNELENINLTGIDLNLEGITFLNNKGFNIINKNIQDFNLNQKYDFILFGNIIEHLQDIEGTINSIKKHMSKNTKLLLWTPNAYCLINFLAILFKGKRKINPGHVLWHSMETLEILLNQHNLKICKYKFFNGKYNGGIINRSMLLLTNIFSIIRPGFSEDIFLEIKLK